MKFLNSLDIASIKSVAFISPTEILINAQSRKGDIKVIFSGIVLIKFSNDHLDKIDQISVVDVEHDYRKIEGNDLVEYDFIASFNENAFHIAKFHGNCVIKIICSSVSFE